METMNDQMQRGRNVKSVLGRSGTTRLHERRPTSNAFYVSVSGLVNSKTEKRFGGFYDPKIIKEKFCPVPTGLFFVVKGSARSQYRGASYEAQLILLHKVMCSRGLSN